MKTRPARGVVLYRGESQIDGAPIICVATLNTANEKTGDMIQTWIILENDNPVEATKTGADFSICGSCILRGTALVDKVESRGCYVNVGQAPLGVWRAYRSGNYPTFDHESHAKLFENRSIRLGSYGDPTAVPKAVWDSVLSLTTHHTGYTHQWADIRFQDFRSILMASVHGERTARMAQERGWRYFRTMGAGEQKNRGEGYCPASEERGNLTDCNTCGACNGAGGNAWRASIVINAHGSKPVMASYAKALAKV